MKIFKGTNTLDNYLPQDLNFTSIKKDSEILLIGGKNINLSEFPNLKGIFKTGVGTDNLPFEEAKTKNISIALPSKSTSEIIFEETASFTCFLILKGLYQNSGNWELWKKEARKSLKKTTLLVIGAGRIGKRVLKKMSNFMEIESYDVLTDKEDNLKSKIQNADVITLHIPLNASTNNMFDANKLAWIKDNALLVNTSRAQVINENDLYDELIKKRFKCAIDVFWQEPYLGKLANLSEDHFIKTPHIASACEEFIKFTTIDFLNFIKKFNNI